MIDIRKCAFEELAVNDDDSTVYYFIYPKDLTEAEFYTEEDYGHIICMCIAITVRDSGDYYVQMSPTVEEGDTLFDVDWRDLYIGVNYTDDILSLIRTLNKKEV